MAIRHDTTAPRSSLWNNDHVGDLDDLDDVTAPSPSANQVVAWSGSAWVNVDPDSGGSLHVDASVSGAHEIDRADGETHDLTLTGNATFTLAGALTSQSTDIRIILRQDGVGSRTVTWPTISWVNGSAPTLETDPNAVNTIGLLSVDDGVTWFGYHAVIPAASTGGGVLLIVAEGITSPPEAVYTEDGTDFVYEEG